MRIAVGVCLMLIGLVIIGSGVWGTVLKKENHTLIADTLFDNSCELTGQHFKARRKTLCKYKCKDGVEMTVETTDGCY